MAQTSTCEVGLFTEQCSKFGQKTVLMSPILLLYQTGLGGNWTRVSWLRRHHISWWAAAKWYKSVQVADMISPTTTSMSGPTGVTDSAVQ